MIVCGQGRVSILNYGTQPRAEWVSVKYCFLSSHTIVGYINDDEEENNNNSNNNITNLKRSYLCPRNGATVTNMKFTKSIAFDFIEWCLEGHNYRFDIFPDSVLPVWKSRVSVPRGDVNNLVLRSWLNAPFQSKSREHSGPNQNLVDLCILRPWGGGRIHAHTLLALGQEYWFFSDIKCTLNTLNVL